jgi:hypothetical protein
MRSPRRKQTYIAAKTGATKNPAKGGLFSPNTKIVEILSKPHRVNGTTASATARYQDDAKAPAKRATRDVTCKTSPNKSEIEWIMAFDQIASTYG